MEGLAQGIANAIPQVAAKAPVIIGKLASTIITNLPKIIQTGVKIITQLAVGLVQGIPALLGKIPIHDQPDQKCIYQCKLGQCWYEYCPGNCKWINKCGKKPGRSSCKRGG